MTITTETPSRRAALGVLASIPAMALPAVAMAGSETAGGLSAHPDADIFALAARCEAAEKHFNATGGAYDVAMLAEPHDQAAMDEAFRLQGIALDDLGDATLPLVWARATTFAGLLAKARALRCLLPEDTRIAIEDALQDTGIFGDEAASLTSLATWSRWPGRARDDHHNKPPHRPGRCPRRCGHRHGHASLIGRARAVGQRSRGPRPLAWSPGKLPDGDVGGEWR